MDLTELTRVTPVAVHFVKPDEIDSDLAALGVTLMEASIGNVKTEEDLFSVIASAMCFPDYFGHNWHALDECLRDMEWLPGNGYVLVLRDATRGWSLSPYVLGRFVTYWLVAFESWSEDNTPFHLVFVM